MVYIQNFLSRLPLKMYRNPRQSSRFLFLHDQYYLPAESRTHVKKFIATHYIFEGQGGLTTLTKKEMIDQLGASAGLIRKLSQSEMNNLNALKVTGKYYSSVIAKNIMMEEEEFNRYNPDFDKLMATSSVYELKLPSEKMTLFVANKYQILTESVELLAANSIDESTPKIAANK